MPTNRAVRQLVMRRRSSSLDTATIAWVAAVVTAGGTVSGIQQTRVDTLIKSLKANGSWTLLDRLWLYASENAFTAKVDLVGLASHTVNGTPTFTPNTGYQQGVTSDYIDTGFQLSSGVNFAQNSASISVYVQTSRTSSNNSVAFGANDAAGTGSQSTFHPLLGTDIFWSANNSSNSFDNVLNPTGDVRGFYTVNRTGLSSIPFYKNSNSTPIATGSNTSTIRPSLNMFVLSQNLNGSNNPSSVSGDRIAMLAMGASLGNGLSIAQFQTDINTYMTAVGANVY